MASVGKGARNKGANGERELANYLKDKLGMDVKRGMVFYHQSDMVGLKGIHPEVKRQEHLNIYSAVEQAETESLIRNDGIPTVFHRRNRGKWLVTMRLDDWIELYKEWENGRT